jgi:hypothetical protein
LLRCILSVIFIFFGAELLWTALQVMNRLAFHRGRFIVLEFFDVLLELAVEYQLPVRLRDPADEQTAGFPFRSLAAEEGVVAPDRIKEVDALSAGTIDDLVDSLDVGVTELIFRPALDTPELRAVDNNPSNCIAHHEALGMGGTLDTALRSASIERIGYRPLRALMREDS